MWVLGKHQFVHPSIGAIRTVSILAQGNLLVILLVGTVLYCTVRFYSQVLHCTVHMPPRKEESAGSQPTAAGSQPTAAEIGCSHVFHMQGQSERCPGHLGYHEQSDETFDNPCNKAVVSGKATLCL